MISRNGLAYLWAGTPPMREWRAKREEAEKRATERPSSKSIRDAEGASGSSRKRQPTPELVIAIPLLACCRDTLQSSS